MARNKAYLVSQHLEGISANALDKYQSVIRDYIKGKYGLYVLYRRNRLYYVGLASNLRSRLKQHLRDRHKGLWDRFSVYLTVENHHIKELESLVLRIVQPKGNVQKGKFPRSQDLKIRLTRDIRSRQRAELETLGPQVETADADILVALEAKDAAYQAHEEAKTAVRALKRVRDPIRVKQMDLQNVIGNLDPSTPPSVPISTCGA